MTDRELLELAAKACGWTLDEDLEDSYPGYVYVIDEEDFHWNPLTDDGDALRLAVKLRMLVDVLPGAEASEAQCAHIKSELQDWNGDPYAATRRAIVRAAAEIGRATP